jgi:hypothetical protein
MPGEVCQTQTGAQALAGKEEYINVYLFKAVDHDRKITGRGKSIMIYDGKINLVEVLLGYSNRAATLEDNGQSSCSESFPFANELGRQLQPI